MNIAELHARYANGDLNPLDYVLGLRETILSHEDYNGWIHVLSQEHLQRLVADLETRKAQGETLPLFGVPFAIKDNIDLAEIPTTAGCPEFAYQPQQSAQVVELLIAAGGIPLGKTNMDQFATGLVGTRSPYGASKNAIAKDFISGGSSSGSALSVALNEVVFALGTDTAGSGRVPAAFHGILGYKPSRGRVSTRGVVPACQTLDCVSVFARNLDDIAVIREVIENYDEQDTWSKDYSNPLNTPGAQSKIMPDPQSKNRSTAHSKTLRIAVPAKSHLGVLSAEYQKGWEAFLAQLEAGQSAGLYEVKTVDYSLFHSAAKLLYQGPWVAERLAILEEFLSRELPGQDAVVRSIILGAAKYSAVDVFRAEYALQDIKKQLRPFWEQFDLLLTPTTITHYRIDEVLADPVQTNTHLGHFTNHMNLLDLCGLAVPAGVVYFADDKKGQIRLPFGVTLQAPAGADGMLMQFAEVLDEF